LIYSVFLIHQIRRLLTNTFIFEIVGEPNAGKSRLLHELEYPSQPGEANTPIPSLYQNTAQTDLGPDKQSVVMIDFPGVPGPKYHTPLNSLYSPMVDCHIFLLSEKNSTSNVAPALIPNYFQGHPENQRPIVVFINQVDRFTKDRP
jgi:GTPase Era involved in 16S rRNA processing